MEKDLAKDLWQNAVPKRRVRKRVLSGNLSSPMQEHQDLFDALVAEVTCEAEMRRSNVYGRAIDIETVSYTHLRAHET